MTAVKPMNHIEFSKAVPKTWPHASRGWALPWRRSAHVPPICRRRTAAPARRRDAASRDARTWPRAGRRRASSMGDQTAAAISLLTAAYHIEKIALSEPKAVSPGPLGFNVC